jgi:plastocyanin
MNRKHLVLASATAMALGAAIPALAAPKAPRSVPLVGTDGPGFTITLTQGGKPVKSLKAGSYTLQVADKSNIHNFRLKGPGIDKATSVSAVSVSSWPVTLKKGTYTFVCDPHAAIMKGSFTVS